MRKEDIEKICQCFKDDKEIQVRKFISRYIISGKNKDTKLALKKYCKETPGGPCPHLNEFWEFTKKHPEFPNCGLCGTIKRNMFFEINEEQEKYLKENSQKVHEQFFAELDNMDIKEITISHNPESRFLQNTFIYFDGRTVSLGTSIDNALALLFKKLINDGILKYKIKFN